jgi:hypothetical protein
MVFKGTGRNMELTGNLGGWDTLSFKSVGGIKINLNRLAARHSKVSSCGCVDSTGVYFGGRCLATVVTH